MQTQLPKEGQLKFLISSYLQDVLFSPLLNDLDNRLDRLIQHNCTLQGYGHKSVYYKGELFVTDDQIPPRKSQRLAPSLIPEMEGFLADKRKFYDDEKLVIVGFLTRILNSINRLDDLYRILPSNLHHRIQDLVSLCTSDKPSISDEQVQQLLENDKEAFHLMKERMALNLLY